MRFLDAVHGFILIPKIYCEKIIDTPLFQRLKRIEQTSTRSIFPCAHHDRFVHSIGTFHIGSKIFHYLKLNTTNDFNGEIINHINYSDHFVSGIQDQGGKFWDNIKIVYELACLLHDCGHAPFSHTFEKYYNNPSQSPSPIRNDIIKLSEEYINSLSLRNPVKNKIKSEFKSDFLSISPAPHELVSAWLVLHNDGFRKAILSISNTADPLLIARMILGCKFNTSGGGLFGKQILNCFISLLNGHEIDADRIDYSIRDKWATGLNTTTINLERLLSTVKITVKDSSLYTICFGKKSLPEIESLIEVKNYVYFWIFNHHKVLYQEMLLMKAVEKLAMLFVDQDKLNNYLSKDNQDKILLDSIENDALYNFFDYNSLVSPKELTAVINGIPINENIYLLSDDDIVSLLKKYFISDYYNADRNIIELTKERNYAKEWFGRDQKLIPIWKSYVEYNINFYSLHKEVLTIEKAIELYKNKQIHNLEEYITLIKENVDLQNDMFEIQDVTKMQSTLAKIIDDYKSFNSLDNLYKYLVMIKSYYDEGLFSDLQSTIKKVIFDVKEEGLILSLDNYKIIDSVTCKTKELKANSIFIEINNNIICYKKLNLPKKSEEKAYKMFYVFLPKLSIDTKEMDRAPTISLYQEKIRKYLLEIRFPIDKNNFNKV